ncbi:unnamed protein product [Auanema sp. JU1783]|nr:unnamed protein product [Auanema sp. JU1783]
MTLFNFYLFNKEGVCVFYKEWKREKQSGMPKSEEFKLMFGMLLSLKSFSERLTPRDGNHTVKFYRTSTYKMNFLETTTGLKMVLNSDPGANGMPELMRQIYEIFVDTVMKNPLVDTTKVLTSELFSSRLDDIVLKHGAYV